MTRPLGKNNKIDIRVIAIIDKKQKNVYIFEMKITY